LDLKMKIKKPKTNRALSAFNAQAFLDTAGVARKVIDYRRGESIYSQGDAADNVMYIQKRGVKLSVVNGSGKEAVVAMLGPSDFFGKGCMAGQTLRMGTTTAVTPTTLLVIQKNELLRVFHAEHELFSLPAAFGKSQALAGSASWRVVGCKQDWHVASAN
jgi:CRP/FNR family cyclic AMP-dependent transcriptional regulator